MKTVNREQLAIEVELHKQTGDKGLLVLGEPGMGKTYSLKTPRMVSAIDLALDYQTMGIAIITEKINAMIQYENLKVTIDDLGSEDKVKNYGTELDPIAYVIQKIYSINQRNPEKPIKLFITSNFNTKTLTEKYGERVMDRLYEMCNIVNLKDTNLRKQNSNI